MSYGKEDQPQPNISKVLKSNTTSKLMNKIQLNLNPGLIKEYSQDIPIKTSDACVIIKELEKSLNAFM